MYKNIRAKLAEHYENEKAKFAEKVHTLTARDVHDFWYYSASLTPAAARIVKELEPDEALPEAVKKKMIQKHARKQDGYMMNSLDKLLRAQESGTPETVTITVEYKRSASWGNYTPHATVEALTKTRRYESKASASGAGYDKTSAAIAHACNANSAVMAILYAHAESGQTFPYSVHTFAGVPSFDGGCGVNCFYAVFDACGYTFKQIANGKTFYVFTITKKEAV